MNVLNVLCMCLTGLVALFTVWTVFLQEQALCRAKRNTSHNYVIVRNWCLIGILTLILIGCAQYLLAPWPHANAACTFVLLLAYAYYFWGRGMKHVVERTEGLNFAKAQGISHRSTNYWTAVGNHERDLPRRSTHT